jgi:hypothetical protein
LKILKGRDCLEDLSQDGMIMIKVNPAKDMEWI